MAVIAKVVQFHWTILICTKTKITCGLSCLVDKLTSYRLSNSATTIWRTDNHLQSPFYCTISFKQNNDIHKLSCSATITLQTCYFQALPTGSVKASRAVYNGFMLQNVGFCAQRRVSGSFFSGTRWGSPPSTTCVWPCSSYPRSLPTFRSPVRSSSVWRPSFCSTQVSRGKPYET